jgi:N utilization substance protein A
MTSVVRHIMNGELLTVIDNLEREKGIDKEVLIQAVEAALASASRKQLGHYSDLTFSVNRETGQIRAFAAKLVTQEVSDPSKEISPDEAKGINSDLSVGDKCQVEIPPKSFGRIAAQTARQVVIQKIREAERELSRKSARRKGK